MIMVCWYSGGIVMKKFLLLIMCFAMIFMFGCGNSNKNENNDKLRITEEVFHDRYNELHTIAEKFQNKYNDNLMTYLKKNYNNNEIIRAYYNRYSINNIYIEHDHELKVVNIFFNTNCKEITIKSFLPNLEKNLINIFINLDQNANVYDWWQTYCKTAAIVAHSFNGKYNFNETDDIIHDLVERYEREPFPIIKNDGISYSIAGPFGSFALFK